MIINIIKQLKENMNILQENKKKELNKMGNQFMTGKQNSVKR